MRISMTVLMNPKISEYLNLFLCFMSFWNVGNPAVPPYANITVPNARKYVLKDGVEYLISSDCKFSIKSLIISHMINTTAIDVVPIAPAAAGQNSPGVPNHINGHNTAAMINIQLQKQIPTASFATL